MTAHGWRCPQCGFWNEAPGEHCYVCGRFRRYSKFVILALVALASCSSPPTRTFLTEAEARCLDGSAYACSLVSRFEDQANEEARQQAIRSAWRQWFYTYRVTHASALSW